MPRKTPKFTKEEAKARARASARAWYLANPEQAKIRNSAWKLANRERVREKAREWRRANPEKVKAQIKRRQYTADPAKARARALARYHANPEKIKAKNNAWRRANPDRVREHHKRGALRRREYKLKQQYGLTIVAYNDLVEASNGLCAVCNKPPRGTRSATKLHVDHCHNTGRVRGLLCHACNVALGMARDNPDTLRRLAMYLEGGPQ